MGDCCISQKLNKMTAWKILCVSLTLLACGTAKDLNARQDDGGDCVDKWPENCAARTEKDRSECYHDSIMKGCCSSCTAKKTGGPGCEFGNKASWCKEYTAADCGSTPGVQEQCCELCSGGGGDGGDGGEY